MPFISRGYFVVDAGTGRTICPEPERKSSWWLSHGHEINHVLATLDGEV